MTDGKLIFIEVHTLDNYVGWKGKTLIVIIEFGKMSRKNVYWI